MRLKHPLQFWFLIQVGGPVDEVEGSEQQGEGYPGDPVNLAHAVEGLLGLRGFGFGLLFWLGGRRGGTLGDGGQSGVSSDIRCEGRRSGGSVRVVLLEK